MVFIPPLILAAAVVLALTEGVFLLCLLDPYRVVFAQGRALFSEAEAALFGAGAVEHTLLIAGNLTAWIIFIAALALSYFVPRIFCRLICPYGVLLGLISILGFCRPKKICGPCGDCGKCGDVCPVDAIEIPSSGGPPRVSSYLCVQCGRCLSVRGKRHRSG
jgi:polyferredoxin